jgi:hypothetical protein
MQDPGKILLALTMATSLSVAIAQAGIAQDSRVIDQGCRQGSCWETVYLGKRLIHQNQIAGEDNQLFAVDLETTLDDETRQTTNWVYCSTSQPFVAFLPNWHDEDLLILHYLNPGGDDAAGYNVSSYKIYWGVCHDLFDTGWGVDQATARSYGYSTTLESYQTELPLALFEAVLSNP